ncbi:RNA polymerase II-associated protein 1 [Mycena venus]|uniref:RNA polymerase II-associated protein 1 n=1 Tax=Mycena venus TaxID=2733690 RepID=A0A8H6Y8P0_9AGAR|nr:RNA polymerase II-associated protein 1 [Mycena venus]
MSSKKNSKLDLLVRVRYSNPLPAPPCPPKLLDIPTNPMRYARPEFLNALANDIPLPMIVDAECGMPLDLGEVGLRWDALDAGNYKHIQTTCPCWTQRTPRYSPSSRLPRLHSATMARSRLVRRHPSPAHVPWLRKTEYISREGVQRSGAQEPKHIISAPIDVSRDAQLRDIEASFAACNDDFSLETLRHPNKPNVRAVESYEVLPDKDIWANQYDLFRFSERPGERALDVEDPRLDCAILRPMKTEHDSFLAYYLTADDESAMKFKETRLALAPYEVPADREETIFHFVRDYETVKVEQEVPNEFMLVIEDEDDLGVGDTAGRPKGAFYKNIERKMLLKKKRVNAYDGYNDKWEIIRMTHVEMGEEEEAERNELLAEVDNPRFLREDVDADGDVELEDAGPLAVVNG